MYADIIVSGMDETEAAAKRILEHVEAIRAEVTKLGIAPVHLSVELKSSAASGN